MKPTPTPVVPVVRALMAGLVDYAGLFPPAGLDLPEAVAAYDAYRRGPLAWVLGRFVIGAARLDELSAVAGSVLPSGPGAVSWRIAALLDEDLGSGLASVDAFNARHARVDSGRAVVDAVEVKSRTASDVGRIVAALPPGLHAAHEVPLDSDLDPVMAAIGHSGGIAKARLGGVVPSAVPSVELVAAWLWSAARHRVPIKATAGLHHPVRGEYPLTYEPDAPRAVTHGFVNVFIAACLAERASAAAGRDDALPLVREALAETDSGAFRFDDTAVRWRTVTIEANEMARTRTRFALSFGSCSFEEPIAGVGLEA